MKIHNLLLFLLIFSTSTSTIEAKVDARNVHITFSGNISQANTAKSMYGHGARIELRPWHIFARSHSDGDLFSWAMQPFYIGFQHRAFNHPDVNFSIAGPVFKMKLFRKWAIGYSTSRIDIKKDKLPALKAIEVDTIGRGENYFFDIDLPISKYFTFNAQFSYYHFSQIDLDISTISAGLRWNFD